MKNRRSKSRGSRGRGRRGKPTGAVRQAAQSANKYNGPVRLPMKAQQAEVYEVNLYQETALTTNGSGVASPVISTSLASFDETSSFQNLYDEWRMIAAECRFVPFSTVPTATLTAGGNMVLVPDRDTATNLTGLAQGLAQGGELHNPFKAGKPAIFKMESSEESAFSGSNSAVQMWFKVYATGLANTTTYGTLVTTALWQFRGRI